jgi:hypothetical protein
VQSRLAENQGRESAYPKRMETGDNEILEASLKLVDKAKADGKPFFLWFNPSPHARHHSSVAEVPALD